MRIRLHRLLAAPRARVLSQDGEVTHLAVDGVVCDQVCAVRTRQALASLPGVERVSVDYERGLATVEGRPHDAQAYSDAIAAVVAGMPARRALDRLTRRVRSKEA